MWKYSKELMDHFMNPRNAGKLEAPDGHSQVGSPQCGDAMTLDIQVDDNDVITDIRFQTFGCAGAIASASALTEMAKGLSLEEAGKIKNSQVAAYLGGMPPEKYHCSVMGHDAVSEAIADFNTRRDAVESAWRKTLGKPSDKLAALLKDRELKVVHFHPARVKVRVTPDGGDIIAPLLSEALSAETGGDVEVIPVP